MCAYPLMQQTGQEQSRADCNVTEDSIFEQHLRNMISNNHFECSNVCEQLSSEALFEQCFRAIKFRSKVLAMLSSRFNNCWSVNYISKHTMNNCW